MSNDNKQRFGFKVEQLVDVDAVSWLKEASKRRGVGVVEVSEWRSVGVLEVLKAKRGSMGINQCPSVDGEVNQRKWKQGGEVVVKCSALQVAPSPPSHKGCYSGKFSRSSRSCTPMSSRDWRESMRLGNNQSHFHLQQRCFELLRRVLPASGRPRRLSENLFLFQRNEHCYGGLPISRGICTEARCVLFNTLRSPASMSTRRTLVERGGGLDVDRVLEDTNNTIREVIDEINDTRQQRRHLTKYDGSHQLTDERRKIGQTLFAASATAAVASQSASLTALAMAERAQAGCVPASLPSPVANAEAFEEDSLDAESMAPTVVHESSHDSAFNSPVFCEQDASEEKYAFEGSPPSGLPNHNDGLRGGVEPPTPLLKYLSQTHSPNHNRHTESQHQRPPPWHDQRQNSSSSKLQSVPCRSAHAHFPWNHDDVSVEQSSFSGDFKWETAVDSPPQQHTSTPEREPVPNEGFDIGQLPPVPVTLGRGIESKHQIQQPEILEQARRVVELLEMRSSASGQSLQQSVSNLTAAEKSIVKNAQNLIDRLIAEEHAMDNELSTRYPCGTDAQCVSTTERGTSEVDTTDSSCAPKKDIEGAKVGESSRAPTQPSKSKSVHKVHGAGQPTSTHEESQRSSSVNARSAPIKWTSEKAAEVFLQRRIPAMTEASRAANPSMTVDQFQGMLAELQRTLTNHIDETLQQHAHSSQVSDTTLPHQSGSVQQASGSAAEQSESRQHGDPTSLMISRVVSNLEKRLEDRLWKNFERAASQWGADVDLQSSDVPTPAPRQKAAQKKLAPKNGHSVSRIAERGEPRVAKKTSKRRQRKCRQCSRVKRDTLKGAKVDAESKPWRPPGKRNVPKTSRAEPRVHHSRQDAKISKAKSKPHKKSVVSWNDRQKLKDMKRTNRKKPTKSRSKQTMQARLGYNSATFGRKHPSMSKVRKPRRSRAKQPKQSSGRNSTEQNLMTAAVQRYQIQAEVRRAEADFRAQLSKMQQTEPVRAGSQFNDSDKRESSTQIARGDEQSSEEADPPGSYSLVAESQSLNASPVKSAWDKTGGDDTTVSAQSSSASTAKWANYAGAEYIENPNVATHDDDDDDDDSWSLDASSHWQTPPLFEDESLG